MNGLSPQATFKPSPNPRYPGSMGRGRGPHRRNLSTHSSAANQSETGSTMANNAPALTQQQSVNAAGAAGGLANTSSGISNAVSNGSSTSVPSKNSSSFQPSVTSNSSSTTTAVTGSGSGRENKESGTSTSHHPVQKQTADSSSTVSGVGPAYSSASNDERRHHHEAHNERGLILLPFLKYLLIFNSVSHCNYILLYNLF